MFSRARAAVNFVGLGLLLGGVFLVAAPGGAGVLDVSWTAPTTNADGSPLTDLASYRVYYGVSNPPCPGSSLFQVASSTPSPPPSQTVTFRLTGLSTGTLYNVSVTAVDAGGNESACSTPASAAAQLELTVSPAGTLNFGSVNVGSFVDQTFTVQSTRSGTVSGTASTSAPFSIVSGSPFTLVGVGATQTVTVRFTPTTPATATTNVNFTADGDTFSRNASGTGIAIDTTPPTVAITSPTSNPTYSTSSSPLTLGGTASDNVGVTQVTWANSRGGSGTSSGTTSWTASGIVLQAGTNVLTVTARDAAGNTATDSVTVTLDTTAPTVAITSPTASPTYTTTSSSLMLGGTASDNIGVTQVTWANSRGGSGMATGTTSWTASGIVLQSGTNVLTVTARDAAGNTSTDSLTVTSDTTPPTVAITSPTSNPTYTTSNSLLTLGGTGSDNLGVTQVTWANSRGGSGTASGTTSWTVSGIVLQSGTNVLTVTARDAVGNTATASVTVSFFTFTDDPLVAQSTPIKTVHITELRAAIDSVRVARGLATFAWTDPTLTPGSTPAKGVHLLELRTALNQAYQAAGRTAPTYTDPTGLTVIKAIHLNELRSAVRAL